MAYQTEDVGPARGPEDQWFFQVRDATNSDLRFGFGGSHNGEGGSVAAHEALFQKIITVLDSDPDMVLVTASRNWSGNQSVTP